MVALTSHNFLQVLTGARSTIEAMGDLVTPLSFASEVLRFQVGAAEAAEGSPAAAAAAEQR